MVTAISLWQASRLSFGSNWIGPMDQHAQLNIEPSIAPQDYTPQKIKPLKQGKQSYIMSHGNNVIGPHMTAITLDPQDPKVGEPQTITVSLRHDAPVTGATVRVISDNNTEPGSPLDLVSGDLVDGTWQTTLSTTDTRDYRYMIYFELLSPTGDWKDSIVLR
jgi:hypothetical protein